MDEQHQPTRETLDRIQREAMERELAHAMNHHPEKVLTNIANLILAHCGATGDGKRGDLRKD